MNLWFIIWVIGVIIGLIGSLFLVSPNADEDEKGWVFLFVVAWPLGLLWIGLVSMCWIIWWPISHAWVWLNKKLYVGK